MESIDPGLNVAQIGAGGVYKFAALPRQRPAGFLRRPALILHFHIEPKLGRVAVEGLGVVVGEAHAQGRPAEHAEVQIGVPSTASSSIGRLTEIAVLAVARRVGPHEVPSLRTPGGTLEDHAGFKYSFNISVTSAQAGKLRLNRYQGHWMARRNGLTGTEKDQTM